MDDDMEKLLAQRAETLAKIKHLVDYIRSRLVPLLAGTQALKPEKESHQPLCNCCHDGEAKQ